jgi:hypothetical protein
MSVVNADALGRPRRSVRSTMKTILMALFALLVFQAPAFAGIDTEISKTNRVILSSGRWQPAGHTNCLTPFLPVLHG